MKVYLFLLSNFVHNQFVNSDFCILTRFNFQYLKESFTESHAASLKFTEHTFIKFNHRFGLLEFNPLRNIGQIVVDPFYFD